MTGHAGEVMKQGQHSSVADENADLYSHLGNQYDDSSGNWELIYLKIQLYHSWKYTKRMPRSTPRVQA